MELWIIYALIGGLFFGIGNFILKSVAALHLNKHKVLLYEMVTTLLLSGGYVLFHGDYVIYLGFFLLCLIILRIILALEKTFFIVESLKHIESGLFFPIHKIVNIILTFFIGMVIFGEYLSWMQYIAVLLGVLMIVLFSSKENKKIQVDYKKGIVYLIAANIAIAFTSSINKYIAISDLDAQVYIFISSAIGVTYLLFTKKQIYKASTRSESRGELRYGILRGSLLYIGFLALLSALAAGPLVLVGTINMLSTIVPVILSMIFYHEKINLSKIFAFILFLIIIVLLSLAK